MVLTPTQVLEKVKPQIEQQCKQMEDHIDAMLLRSRGTGLSGISVARFDWHIRQEVKKKYVQAGWKVEEHSDQRDNDTYWTLTPFREI